MKRLIFVIVTFFVGMYLYTMNSTENRQMLVDLNSLDYLSFKTKYIRSIGDDSDELITRCYRVYNGLLGRQFVKDYSDPDIKSRLVRMELCDLDEGSLVLKGFFLEDTLPRLSVGKPRAKDEKVKKT